jgi:hypothetical protein
VKGVKERSEKAKRRETKRFENTTGGHPPRYYHTPFQLRRRS